MIVYDKETGIILGQSYPTPPNVEMYMANYPSGSEMLISDLVENVHLYKIQDGELTLLNENELYELNNYGRFLTEEERVLEKLKPSREEVRKAEQTIEILSILQEVL